MSRDGDTFRLRVAAAAVLVIAAIAAHHRAPETAVAPIPGAKRAAAGVVNRCRL